MSHFGNEQNPLYGLPREPIAFCGAGSYTRRVVAALICLIGMVMLFNFVVDPLQVYRRASYPPHFSENQRYQNPGLARHYTEPVLVIGTSHTENWLPSDIHDIFDQRALKLSVAGSGFFEQGRLFDLAVESGGVQRVLWGIDHGSTLWRDRPTDVFGPFPHFLYGPVWKTIFPYLLSVDTLRRSFTALTSEPIHSLDELNAWYGTTQFGSEQIQSAWKAMDQRWDDDLYEYYQTQVPRWAEVEGLVKDHVVKRAIDHPEIRFDLVFMPYSIFEYVNDFRVDQERFFQRLMLKNQLADWGERLPNVYVWDFQGRREWIYDESRYSDLAHFDLRTSMSMLQAIDQFNEPWPILPAKEHVEMVLEKMGELCDFEHNQSLWCPRRIDCGRYRLNRWLSSGAKTDELLEAASLECPTVLPGQQNSVPSTAESSQALSMHNMALH